MTASFAAELLRVVGPTGVVALNLTDRAPFGWTRRAVAASAHGVPAAAADRRAGHAARPSGSATWSSSPRPAPVPVSALQARATTAVSPYRVLDGRAVSDSFGGGTPFTDVDAEPSPAPA